MKKRKPAKPAALAGSVLLASSLLSGCIGPAVAVYGPPPEREATEPPFREEDNIPAPVYGPAPDFDPADNIPEDVYGPPVYFGMDEEADESEESQVPEGTGEQD